ncbi:hypothetical protein [Halobacillus seohaensis]|uniref:YneQ n=1 Tax=Halobacillus seohaensis TaxID=447421 RepID=A0ABW2EHN8_9BACI
MAFGVKRVELVEWKKKVEQGDIAFLTHYWIDDRFPECDTVTKVGCANMDKLVKWGEAYQLKAEWIHHDSKYPHFDLLGNRQYEILKKENQEEQLKRFSLRQK